jgi:hypothetical protein
MPTKAAMIKNGASIIFCPYSGGKLVVGIADFEDVGGATGGGANDGAGLNAGAGGVIGGAIVLFVFIDVPANFSCVLPNAAIPNTAPIAIWNNPAPCKVKGFHCVMG